MQIKLFEEWVNESTHDKATYDEIADFEKDNNCGTKPVNLYIVYQTRYNGLDAYMVCDDVDDDFDIGFSANPSWGKDMYKKGKTGKQVLNFFFDDNAAGYLVKTKKLTINGEDYEENKIFYAEKGTDS